MSLRSKSREFALQMLFQSELGREEPARLEVAFWQGARAEAATREFANQLFEGTAADTARLDALIESHADNWRVGRMSVIDRAILRLAAYELTRTSTPPKVVLDEAIELAKRFSGDEAAPFVNGVLDAIARSLGEVQGEAAPKKEEGAAEGT
ncbi:MAG: transcription antitermination factor NusB [Candidatus Acidiferrales bacterium]